MQSAVEMGKLMIPVAKVMDSGTYTCSVVGVPGDYSESARLDVVASKLPRFTEVLFTHIAKLLVCFNFLISVIQYKEEILFTTLVLCLQLVPSHQTMIQEVVHESRRCVRTVSVSRGSTGVMENKIVLTAQMNPQIAVCTTKATI